MQKTRKFTKLGRKPSRLNVLIKQIMELLKEIKREAKLKNKGK